jgi:hypothetical protein
VEINPQSGGGTVELYPQTVNILTVETDPQTGDGTVETDPQPGDGTWR